MCAYAMIEEKQLTLLDGVRIEPPDCYPAVFNALEVALYNHPKIEQWDAEKLALDISEFGQIVGCPALRDIEKCIAIYRERWWDDRNT